MPLKRYGVLAARAVDRRREGSSDTPHYQIHLTDDAGTHYRAAVNVESQQAPSELLYLADDNFRHPVTQLLPPAGGGWTALPSQPGAAALDFIRGNLFDPASMRTLPPDLVGADNDLADLLDHYVQRAIADPTAALYVFGQQWGPETGAADKVFGFEPGNGVHDIHMNQGNSGRFRSDNGVRQDGALLVHLPAEDRWVAVFLAFQSQAWHTDNATGNPIGTAPPRPSDHEEPVRIMAALVNPVGPAPEAETITVLNASPAPVDLRGWHLADQNRQTIPLPTGTLPPGTTLTVPADGNGFHLGDQGGTITLLDPDGLKVHGVSYTAQQARREGRTITF
ncbi:DUF2278 family protein [Streptomyces sp. BK340]|uniref:DUF2278 family protein n=1 Tax=Streptomyces sp. BK340 TaxID=2572903 RepID=UPI0011A11D74|nr:DUF2278 family protein [Streptomyces sp. BK340]TVZ96440.1 uncharacterized protein YukJ [Streptomyces sp. BK340]